MAADLADQALCQALSPNSVGDAAPDVLNPLYNPLGGHSLPLAKVYASLFNGDMRILSMQGHGTDTYIYISKLDHNVLPT